MDPNATLYRILRAIDSMMEKEDEIDTGEAVGLVYLVLDLHEWIVKGGFLPEQWSAKECGRKE